MTGKRTAAALCAALAVLLAACGNSTAAATSNSVEISSSVGTSNDAGTSAGAGTSTQPATGATAAGPGPSSGSVSAGPAGGSGSGGSVSPAATSNQLRVEADDTATAMSYRIQGQPHPGRVRITFVNEGEVAHEMGLSLTKPGVTLDQLTAALAKGEDEARKLLIDPDTEIAGPGILGPGLTETTTVDLAAGHYVVVCFLPATGGMPHVAMGMIGEFTVGGAPSTDPAPGTSGTVTLTDTSITVPSGFGAGGTYAVTNTGTKPHDFSLAALKDQPLAALFQCVGQSMGKGTPIDDCPGTLAGGVTTLAPGRTAYLSLTLASGHYGYLSTQGDGADVAAGLQGTFDVG